MQRVDQNCKIRKIQWIITRKGRERDLGAATHGLFHGRHHNKDRSRVESRMGQTAAQLPGLLAEGARVAHVVGQEITCHFNLLALCFVPYHALAAAAARSSERLKATLKQENGY